MDKERLKLIVRNMESLLDCLKAELYVSDNNLHYSEISNYLTDYDEIYNEEDD
jgi:hypothetical protein